MRIVVLQTEVHKPDITTTTCVLKSINARNGNGSVIEYKTRLFLSPEEKDEVRGLYGVVYEESGLLRLSTGLMSRLMASTGTAEQ